MTPPPCVRRRRARRTGAAAGHRARSRGACARRGPRAPGQAAGRRRHRPPRAGRRHRPGRGQGPANRPRVGPSPSYSEHLGSAKGAPREPREQGALPCALRALRAPLGTGPAQHVGEHMGMEHPARGRHVVRNGVQGLIYAGDIARGFDVYACGSAEQKCDPVVTLTKFGPPSAAQGSGVNYELAYHNAGPAASTIAKIVDRLPSELRFGSASDGGSYNFSTRTVTWRLGSVDVGETGEVSLNARVPSTVPVGTAMINKADFTGDLTISPPTAVTVTWVTPGSTTAAALGGTSLIRYSTSSPPQPSVDQVGEPPGRPRRCPGGCCARRLPRSRTRCGPPAHRHQQPRQQSRAH